MEVATVDDPGVTQSDEPQPAVSANPIEEPAETGLETSGPVDEASSLEVDDPVADPAADEEEDPIDTQVLLEDGEEDDVEVVIGEVKEPAEEEDEEGDLEQFLAGAKRFTRIVQLDESAQGVSLPDSTVPRAKPVRWTHRAYRGDVEVISAKSSRGATLAVFGDGLLLVESASGAIAGLVPALTGRRPARKVVTRAGSSMDAAARLQGSRRLATLDIHSVHIAKGRAWARELTIRTTQGEELHYRFSSKRYGRLVALLSPVLGPKLRHIRKGERASRRAG